MRPQTRRSFLKRFLGGSASLAAAGTERTLYAARDKDRIRKQGMFYRLLGRTGLWISEISLGGSPVPDWALMMEIVERGVNYIDTSHSYMNGNSERQIGRLMKQVGRDRLHVGTKFHLRGNWTTSSIMKSAEDSLRRLQTDYLDVLLIHGAENPDHLTDERVTAAFQKLKEQGKCRFSGLSCHANHHQVVRKAVECGHYDMVQVGYNVFDIEETQTEVETYDDYLGASGTRRLIRLAKSRDVGVIAMKTLKVGGRRQDLERYRTGTTSLFQAMLKWALENRNITSVVTEMLSFREMEEDLAVVGSPLDAAERRTLYRYVARCLGDYCHQCGRCRKACPAGINTTSVLRFLAYHESYGKTARARRAYAAIPPENRAESCQDCGRCEMACPYGLPVRRKLRQARLLLA